MAVEYSRGGGGGLLMEVANLELNGQSNQGLIRQPGFETIVTRYFLVQSSALETRGLARRGSARLEGSDTGLGNARGVVF